MKTKLAVSRLLKAALSLNGASLIRTLRSGPREAGKRLQNSYQAIDPFSTVENQPEKILLLRTPEKQLSEIVPWPQEITLDLRFADVSGSTPIADITAILALAIAQQPEAALEFGTFWGSGTCNLARNLPCATIHAIDLPPDHAAAKSLIEGLPVDDLHLIESRQLGCAFRGSLIEQHIVQHLGDTAAYDYSSIPGKLSFFLIDGSHTYEYAKSDTLHAFSIANGMSTFAWHDCDETHPGVTRWLGELLDAGLPVQRIAGTVVACLRIPSGDERLRHLLSTQPNY